jgi:uncharacterized membrane protein
MSRRRGFLSKGGRSRLTRAWRLCLTESNKGADRIGDGAMILALAAVVALCLFVRLYNLGGQGLHCEELFTIPAATGHHYVYLKDQSALRLDSFPTTRAEYAALLRPEGGKGLGDVTEVLTRNVHMPLYFYLMHYWVGAFGASEWSLRLPSVVFGALAVLMLFFLGRELFGPAVGLTAALLAALMPEQVYFSQEARMYTLLVLLVISTTWLLLRAIGRRPALPRGQSPAPFPTVHAAPLVAYVLLSVAGLYTHYVYVFCFGAQALFVWLEALRARRPPAGRWIAAQALAAAACVPWLLNGAAQKDSSTEMLAWARATPTFTSVVAAVVARLSRLVAVPEVPFGWLTVVAALALLGSGVYALRRDRSRLTLLALWLLVPLAGIVFLDVVLQTRAVGVTRYWMVMTPALYLLMAVGAVKLGASPRLPAAARAVAAAALAAALVAAGFATAAGALRAKPDRYGELANLLDNYTVSERNNEVVITEGTNAIPLALGYYGGKNLRVLRSSYLQERLRGTELRDLIGDADVWLVSSTESNVKAFLEKRGYRLVNRPIRFGHITLYGYAAPARGAE